jgi:hypothetical protein
MSWCRRRRRRRRGSADADGLEATSVRSRDGSSPCSKLGVGLFAPAGVATVHASKGCAGMHAPRATDSASSAAVTARTAALMCAMPIGSRWYDTGAIIHGRNTDPEVASQTGWPTCPPERRLRALRVRQGTHGTHSSLFFERLREPRSSIRIRVRIESLCAQQLFAHNGDCTQGDGCNTDG